MVINLVLEEMQDLWKELTGSSVVGSKNQLPTSGKEDFKQLFSRLVGFSSLSFIVQKIGKYHEIMGTDATGITAGWTQASPLTFGNNQSPLRVGDMMGRPHDVYRLIFWNPKQMELLEGKHQFVLFNTDYGSGKK